VPDEVELAGGNANRVVRIGDTIRRPAGPWTPAVHCLLDHLHEVGFTAAPRPLGVDAKGREVLTFIPGEAVWPAHFALLDPPARLARVAHLIRALHVAAESFVPPPAAHWNVLVPADGDDLIVHHDLAPWNLIHGPADTWTFIDWDCAAPGTRLWDLAYAIHGFIPLSANPAHQRPDTDHRLRVFVNAYGLDEQQRQELIPLLSRRCRAMYDFLRAQSAEGVEPWRTLWGEGHGAAWSRDADWIGQRRERWERIVCS
jgi:aminoglycoside phosphotransferase (APT) family kinase protein